MMLFLQQYAFRDDSELNSCIKSHINSKCIASTTHDTQLCNIFSYLNFRFHFNCTTNDIPFTITNGDPLSLKP